MYCTNESGDRWRESHRTCSNRVLDTRLKIVQPGLVDRRARPLLAVVGYFDPMYAAHVRRLAELRMPDTCLTVVIADPDEPLMPSRARAEVVAGLRMVDFVVEAGLDVEQVLAQLAADVVHRDEAADSGRMRALANHVASRHQLV